MTRSPFDLEFFIWAGVAVAATIVAYVVTLIVWPKTDENRPNLIHVSLLSEPASAALAGVSVVGTPDTLAGPIVLASLSGTL